MPIDDTDISGMEPVAAKEYVLAFIKSLKETQLQKSRKVEELELWQERVRLAREKGRLDLAAEADRRVDVLRDEVAALEVEEEELLEKVSRLKENLKTAESQFRFSIDAQTLLANLEMVTGERDETAEEFDKMRAQSALEELKKKMQEEDSGS